MLNYTFKKFRTYTVMYLKNLCFPIHQTLIVCLPQHLIIGNRHDWYLSSWIYGFISISIINISFGGSLQIKISKNFKISYSNTQFWFQISILETIHPQTKFTHSVCLFKNSANAKF